jgi:Protein of unknown function (DUF559)
MGDDRRVSGSYPHELAKVRVARITKRQHNRIAAHQLTRLGVGGSTVRDWMRAGYLHPRLRGVYGVGSPARTTESELFDAVLYAGPGAMLSHTTAASWLGLIDHASPLIHVSTPRRRTAPRGILIHNRRIGLERVVSNGIPTTTVAQALLDLAAMGELTLVRRALARLDYQRSFHPHALLAECGYGRRGSQALEWAIANFDPRFAHTRSPFEDDWLICCEQLDIPKPDGVNVLISGIRVDACYYDAKLIIEFDGTDNHRSPAQVRRDRRDEFKLRTAGWIVLRYSSDLIHDDAPGVRTEVLHHLETRAGRGTGTTGPAPNRR